MDEQCAPIALFVYNRAQHTRATISALADNVLAKNSDLFIFCDGPKSEKDVLAVEETRKIVRRVAGFKSVTLIEADSNNGLASSVIQGVSRMLDQFERTIVLEDDLVTSKYFLTFMNNALKYYSNDPKVFSVTGHTFPDSIFQIPKNYLYDTYSGYRCSSWSWGTWRDRWEKIDWGMNYYPEFIADMNQQTAFNQGGEDLTPMLSMQYGQMIDSWAIRFSFAHFINDCRCIYPTKTLVRNIGLDNSGTHTRLDRRFFHASVDSNWQPIKYCKADPVDIEIVEKFRKIFIDEKVSVYARIKIKVLRALKMFQLRLRSILDHLMRPSTVMVQKTDILMINTIQLQGGAARAAFRCFNGMRNLYPNAGYLSLFGELSQNQLYFLDKTSLIGKLTSRFSVLDRLQLLLYPNRKAVIFSPGLWANPRRIRANSFSPKLIHLHWVSYGILNINEISDFNIPIVWTLHDEWAFTGGCHYADSCRRFENQCGCCPLLGSDNPYDISNELWLQKMVAYNKSNIVVVAPSRWMASEAKKSSLFSHKRIEVIPNGLDVDIFCPIDRDEASKFFNIELTAPILLFGANLVSDDRKGGDLLLKALNMINFSCTLLVFGEGDIGLISNSYVKLHRVGNIEDDHRLAMMYSLADVFICPSRIDNLPNTVAEAMACGVPCVAFCIGGLPDMIDHMQNGWLAPPFDVADLFKGIKWVLEHERPSSLRQSARGKALSEYSLSVMSRRYESLYENLLSMEGK
ncbi:hypothetical protein PKF023_03580 [Polynucleobacter yangtzensis]|uniref:Glycosyltransferase subfamily 4-like N-terminal domain-containing protein n=1 Tax=Polynucleobacter yangtzensis TaxID=1743159 RepID=A0A9C7F9S2_9BURK|nr:glycosyltransferase [Polynucleobacter yangtzensis]BDT76555.1 hypothetical protein PKF023_03580 [Polynucleobacter yangtzensis]